MTRGINTPAICMPGLKPNPASGFLRILSS